MAAPWTPSHTNVSYSKGVGITKVAPTERANVFLPDGTAPSGGWPVMLWIEETLLTSGTRQTSIASTAQGHQYLARGVAFVSATVCRVASSGAEAVTGGGLFIRPGEAGWDSDTTLSAWKSAVHLIQWARSQAATYGFNPDEIAIGGELMGADLALWAGAGPDRSASAQFRAGVSHRANAIVALRPTGWFLGVAIMASATGTGFAESGVPGTAAVEMGDVDPLDLDAASPCSALFSGSTERTANATQPVFVWASGARGSASFELISNLPTLSNTLPAIGDAWGAQMIRRELVGLSAAAFDWHARNSHALHALRYHDPDGYPTEILAADADVYERAAAWVWATAGNAPPLDPVAERIVRNLMAVLRTPVAGATYWNTVHDVKRGPALVPVAPITATTVYVTSLGSDSQGYGRDTMARILSTLRVEVLALTNTSASDAPGVINRLASDLETAIYTDRRLGGLVTETIVTNREPILPADGHTPIHGVLMDLDITYQTPATELLTHS